MQDVDLTYENYAADPDYITANRAFVARLDLGPVSRTADLACGTGLITRLLFEAKPGLVTAGIDYDPVQIELASRDIAADGIPLIDSFEDWASAERGVWLNAASAMELPFEDASIDLVTIGNAIHMMPNYRAFVAEVARVLKPGGQFAFNSVFYAGTFVEGTEPVFTECMKEAVIVLNEMQAERRERGEEKIPRKRGTHARAFSTEWLSEGEWGALVRDAGFTVGQSGHRQMPISRAAMEAIGAYGGLAEVLMSGYPVEIASQCMARGINRAFRNLGITEVPRNWLEIIATRD
ncbi:class I SAM-dependent methyltransferase [Pseudoroseicyclus sp. H15]